MIAVKNIWLIIGKSTFLRQILMLHGIKSSELEKEAYKTDIIKLCRKNFSKILDAIKSNNLESQIDVPEFEVLFTTNIYSEEV